MHPGFFLHVALHRSTRFFLFLALWAAPFVASAATPIGYFDAIDSDGVISGWAVDLDAPSTSIDVHVYMDGPAGGGGKLIGIAKAAFPRPDVNQAIGYPGDYGFKYSLPPITRDGATHTYYVYGIDTSGIGPENRLLIGSPKTAALPSTIVRIDNGTIKVGIEPRCGGTIAEISFNGTNLVNNYDCTGRQIQVAQYDGNSTYDACAGCTETWGWDPVQGGDRNGFGSVVLSQTVTRNSIYIKTQPYQWFPEDKGGGPGRPVLSDVVVEQWLSFVPGSSYAVKMHSKITHQGNDNHSLAVQEFPATYVNPGFDSMVYYSGVSPWTGGPISIATVQAGIIYNAAENWAAFVNARGNGLTVYVPGQYPYMSGFRMDDPVPGPYSNGFNYFAPFVPFEFKAGSVLEGDIYLIAGDYTLARQFIYGLRSSAVTADFLPPFGYLDTPTSGQVLSGKISVAGWAFDNSSINRIEVLVDGAVAGIATYGQPRPDVASVFPNLSSNTGYFYPLDTTKYSNGQHTITVNAVDSVGNMTGLTKTVTVNLTNSLPPPPPAAKFLLGDRVKVTANRLNIYLAPSGKKIGTQFLNVLGTVIDGPVAKGGYTWWNVNFDSGVDGWAIESYLKK
jgi:hypothetical protein